MKTVSEIADLLAADLGLSADSMREMVGDHVDLTQEATARDAAGLLLAGLVHSLGGSVADVRMIAALPHEATHRFLPTESGLHGDIVPAGLGLEDAIRKLRTAGALLGAYAQMYVESDSTWLLPAGMEVRLAKGRPFVELTFRAATRDDPQALRLAVRYSMQPCGGGVRPDDAPPAEIERTARVPGNAFERIRLHVTGHLPPAVLEVDPSNCIPPGVTLQ